MESLLTDIINWLIAVGPIVVFVVALAETAFFIGLLIPAEATVLVAAFLASEGTFELSHVVAATLAGAFLGDQIGYILGRFGGARAAAGDGRIARLWSRYEPRATALFRKHSIVAVSLARFISFVRTLMPWFAGMTRVPWGRFMFFDALGVIGWGVASIAAGYIAAESWRRVANVLGTTSAIILAALVIVVLILYRRTRPSPRAGAGPAGQSKPDVAPEDPQGATR